MESNEGPSKFVEYPNHEQIINEISRILINANSIEALRNPDDIGEFAICAESSLKFHESGLTSVVMYASKWSEKAMKVYEEFGLPPLAEVLLTDCADDEFAIQRWYHVNRDGSVTRINGISYLDGDGNEVFWTDKVQPYSRSNDFSEELLRELKAIDVLS